MNNITSLPEPFDSLECFVRKWDKHGSDARYSERLASEYSELERFHEAVGARGEEIKSYLDGIRLADLGEADRRLGRLLFAWTCVAMAVEIFGQPRVPRTRSQWKVEFEPDL